MWRGPADVVFDPPFSMVEGGTAKTSAMFSAPGTYVLQARAYDGGKSTYEFLTLTVN